jgi:hypothetical protein
VLADRPVRFIDSLRLLDLAGRELDSPPIFSSETDAVGRAVGPHVKGIPDTLAASQRDVVALPCHDGKLRKKVLQNQLHEISCFILRIAAAGTTPGVRPEDQKAVFRFGFVDWFFGDLPLDVRQVGSRERQRTEDDEVEKGWEKQTVHGKPPNHIGGCQKDSAWL